MGVADGGLGGFGPSGEGDSENVAAESQGEDGKESPRLWRERGELIPGKEGEGGEGIDEGAGPGHEEEAGGVDFVPLGVGENADDDACGKEPGHGGHDGAEDEACSHEDESEDEDGFSLPTSGRDGAVGAGFRIEGEIVPVVEKAPTEIEAGEGDGDHSEATRANVSGGVEASITDEGAEQSVGPYGGEIGEPAHGEEVDDFLAIHGCWKKSKAGGSLEDLFARDFLVDPGWGQEGFGEREGED